jgi:hypothetical protein
MLPGKPDPATPPAGDILEAVMLLPVLLVLSGDLLDPRAQSVVRRHCLECHSGAQAKAELRFDLQQPGAGLDAPAWREIWTRVHAGEMPPRKHGVLPPSDRTLLLELGVSLAGAGEERSVLRRLSRREYENTVRDLFGIVFDAREHFAPDEIGAGFDNQGAALSLSEADFERYLQAGERVAAAAIQVRDPGASNHQRVRAEAMEGGALRHDVRTLSSNGQIRASFRIEAEGRYRVRARCFGTQAGPDPVRWAMSSGGREFARGATRATLKQREEVMGELTLTAGPRSIEYAFLNDYYKPDDPDPRQRDRNCHLEWIEIEGPLDPPRYSPYQSAELVDLGESNLRSKLAALATRVWRGPVSSSDMDALLALTNAAHRPVERMRTALAAMLAAPRFLFRLENDPESAAPGSLRPLNGHELAVRLSYLVWGSLPDDVLLQRAADGSLLKDEVLEAELARMLRDPRASELSRSFALQWLQLEALGNHALDDGLRESMLAETSLLFECVLREERPIRELLCAEYSFIDERLAALYGMALPRGPGMQRVALPAGDRRGVLGHASVLTVTSNPTRTSPVKRGKWVLEVLLDAPPPPPPPGVGVLTEADAGGAPLPMREQLALHRSKPECAVCHDRLDPLGLGLENYDHMGRARSADEGGLIDGAGALPDGRAFRGAGEMARLLASDGALTRSLARHLMTWSLGRSLSVAERAALEQRMAAQDAQQLTLPGLLRAIVLSEPFRTKRVE